MILVQGLLRFGRVFAATALVAIGLTIALPVQSAAADEATYCVLGTDGKPYHEGGTQGQSTTTQDASGSTSTFSITFPDGTKCDWVATTKVQGSPAIATTTYTKSGDPIPGNGTDLPPSGKNDDVEYSTNCRLVDTPDGPKPNTEGGTIGPPQIISTSGPISEATIDVTFPGEVCHYNVHLKTGTTPADILIGSSFTYTGSSGTCLMVNNYDVCPIRQLSNGLTFYTLILCVTGLFISAGLWAMGSRGQHPGQELTGKRGIVVCLVGAFIIGALPGIIHYMEQQTDSTDNTGVTTAQLPGQ